MSIPLTTNELKKVLVDEGLTVVEYSNWRNRCRCHSGSHEKGEGWLGNTAERGWGRVNGIVNHITGGNLGTKTVEEYIASAILGDPDIPCKVQMVVAPNGAVYLVSAGRSNHAGKVGSDVQYHMISADFSTTDNYDDRFRGLAVDGNAFTYGVENIAASQMTPAQRASSVKINAAIARHYGWTGQESVGHGEISSARYYVDPGLDMGKFRRDVMAAVVAGTAAPEEPAPTPEEPAPTPPPSTVPTPGPKPGPVITSGLQNMGSYNAFGAKTYKSRTDKYVAERLKTPVDIIDFQEVGNGINLPGKPNCLMRSRLDSGLDGEYTRHHGSDGRYTYTNDHTGVNSIETGVFTAKKSTWFEGDDKQAAWNAYIKDGVKGMDVSVHLESDDASGVSDQKQLLDFLSQALAVCQRLGIDPRNLMICGDTNSEGSVITAMAGVGWRNVAKGGPFENSYTFMGWDGKSRKRFDYGFVRNDAAEAEVVAINRDTGISDHAGVRIKRTLTRVA